MGMATGTIRMVMATPAPTVIIVRPWLFVRAIIHRLPEFTGVVQELVVASEVVITGAGVAVRVDRGK